MSDDDVLSFDVQVKNPPVVQVIETLQDLDDVGHHIILRVAKPAEGQETQFTNTHIHSTYIVHL